MQLLIIGLKIMLSDHVGSHGIPWGHLFLAIIWGIWLNRNDGVFNRVSFSTHKVTREATNLAMDMQIPLD